MSSKIKAVSTACLIACIQFTPSKSEQISCFVTNHQTLLIKNNLSRRIDHFRQVKRTNRRVQKSSSVSFKKSGNDSILMDELDLDENNFNTSINTSNEIDEESLSSYILQKSNEVKKQIEEQARKLQESQFGFENKSTIEDSLLEGKLYRDSIQSDKISTESGLEVFIDELQIKQLDSSITVLPDIDTALKDLDILTSKSSIIIPSRAASPGTSTINKISPKPTPSISQDSSVDKTTKKSFRKKLFKNIFRRSKRMSEKSDEEKTETDKLPADNPDLNRDRIQRDIRQLAVRIASSIETPEQLTLFCKENGGFQPLFECIHECALSISMNSYDLSDFTRSPTNENQTKGMIEQEELFSAACTACKSLRDLCALSPDVASIVTDTAIRLDKEREKRNERTLLGDLIDLLKYNNNFETTIQSILSLDGSASLTTIRRRRALARERRRRCRLYILQLLLAMAFANDEAILRLRSTPGLKDAVMACSSYANLKEEKPADLRSRIDFLANLMSISESKVNQLGGPRTIKMTKPKLDPKTKIRESRSDEKKSKRKELESPANKLLAAIGYNIWVPKAEGQKGLRILCLDGGGTRGIASLASLRAIVDAVGGVEPSDAFDIICGTSTGGIIAFLIGLRRETIGFAKKRYDTLIKRIFVKSALATPMLVFTTASYDEAHFTEVMREILGETSMLDSRADPKVPLVFAVSSKMSSTPTQLCLFRNYNYNGGEMPDKFVVNPEIAKKNLDLPLEQFDNENVDGKVPGKSYSQPDGKDKITVVSPVRTGEGSRHTGSFRVLQRIALRASTAAPTFFKPLLMGGELYCDGGVGASNPTAVAIHEARSLFPDTPIELVVSLGTGAFEEEISAPKIGWDGIIGQIVNSALDAEQTHHTLEDILGQGGTAQLGKSSVSETRYYRFNPCIGKSDAFPIDEIDPDKLEELTQITSAYMRESEQARKLSEIKDIINPQRKREKWWGKFFSKQKEEVEY